MSAAQRNVAFIAADLDLRALAEQQAHARAQAARRRAVQAGQARGVLEVWRGGARQQGARSRRRRRSQARRPQPRQDHFFQANDVSFHGWLVPLPLWYLKTC